MIFKILGSRGKNEAIGINLSALGARPEIVLGGFIHFGKPENAFGKALEKPHPYIEGFWVEFIAVVETAKYKGVFGQSDICP